MNIYTIQYLKSGSIKELTVVAKSEVRALEFWTKYKLKLWLYSGDGFRSITHKQEGVLLAR